MISSGQIILIVHQPSHLDFREIKGFPFLSYLVEWGCVRSLYFDQMILKGVKRLEKQVPKKTWMFGSWDKIQIGEILDVVAYNNKKIE